MEISKELEQTISNMVEELIDEAELWKYNDDLPWEVITTTADNVASYFDSSEDIPDWDIDWKKLYTEVTQLVTNMLINDEVNPENFSEEVLDLLKTY
tara:strand:+ start:5300 stop:5590 length:291 start_codon:yes stop_codon:yes gene_type:complete